MSFAHPAFAALAFLPGAVIVAVWVMWSDMARMKIPNRAVIALLIVFALVGPFVLPFDAYAWRWLHVVVVLLIGFVLNMGGVMGAGDAKFAAAMAPFIALDDLSLVIRLFAAVLLGAFAAHRLWRAVPVARGFAPGWESWRRQDFPMGLALGGFLVAYLGLAALYGR